MNRLGRYLSTDIVALVGLTGALGGLGVLSRGPGPIRRRADRLGRRVFDWHTRYAYRCFARFAGESGQYFMNYGIALDDTTPGPELRPADEPDRLFIQMYHRVIGPVDLAGRDVLEVSSGHGGGSRFVARYLGPRRMVGVDLNPRAIDLCRRHHDEEGLEYHVANAVELPFDDESFDAVMSVEASHCYPSFPQFLREVRRVLKPGGHLLFADLRWQDGLRREMKRDLERSGMEVLESEDLTRRVIASLEAYASVRRTTLSETVPRPFLDIALKHSAVPGSPAFDWFVNGEGTYSRFLLRKPVA